MSSAHLHPPFFFLSIKKFVSFWPSILMVVVMRALSFSCYSCWVVLVPLCACPPPPFFLFIVQSSLYSPPPPLFLFLFPFTRFIYICKFNKCYLIYICIFGLYKLQISMNFLPLSCLSLRFYLKTLYHHQSMYVFVHIPYLSNIFMKKILLIFF